LFTELLSNEKLNWIKNSLRFFHQDKEFGSDKQQKTSSLYHISIFLTGDAIFNLIDQRYSKCIQDLLVNFEVSIILDSDELQLYGFEYKDVFKNFKIKSSLLESKIRIKENFWTYLINNVKIKNEKNTVGFFQFEGPYMSRTSVYATRFIENALKNQVNVDLFTYLDGVHNGHTHQKPSEFENIAEKLIDLKELAKAENLGFNMLSCSRCATARGYIKKPTNEEFIQSNDLIKDFYICNLNKIVERFEHNFVIMTSNSGSLQFDEMSDSNVSYEYEDPQNIIVITHSPYNSEWSFGAISFAMASATHEIHTKVLFIEEGIYSMVGNHKIDESEKLFNFQEIIPATADMEYLDYYVYNPSLRRRNLSVRNDIKDYVKYIKKYEIGNILFKANKNKPKYQNRIIIF
jgi:tRNA 2-thiouridine synthesizing protein C